MTLLLKILAPLVVLFSALIQASLDYFWADRRTKKHRRAKAVFFLLMIVGGACSIAVVVIDYQDSNTLIKEIRSLEAKLNPFLELAKARFPSLDSGEALKRLSAEIKELEEQTKKLEIKSIEEKAKRLELANQLDVEKSKIRDLGVDLTVDFRGEWSQEPWVYILSSVSDEFYIFLWSQKEKSNLPILKFFATEPYRFSTTGKGQARFQAHQAIRRGDAPLGDSISKLTNYDALGLWIPLVEHNQLKTQEITITRIEMVYTFNGKRGKPVILERTFKASVKPYGEDKHTGWAGVSQPFNSDTWKGMWSN